MAIFIALSAILYSIIIFRMPLGGEVTLGGMVPLLWFSLRRGVKAGIIAGIIFGLVLMVLEPYLYAPFQVLLDYPLAFGALGLAGFFKKYPVVGVGVGISCRFVSHFFSGVIFANFFIPAGVNPYIYSAAYNGAYLIPEFIISAAIIYILARENVLNYNLQAQ